MTRRGVAFFAVLVLLDRSMYGGPGESYVPEIRACAPRIPIMLFTGQAVGPEVSALVDRVLLKPITGGMLVAAIEELVASLADG